MGELVSYPGHGSDSTGHLAIPQQPAPGVVVIRGAWGLVDHIYTVADRFAEAGYAALALDLHPAPAGVPEVGADAVAEVVAAAGYLAARPEVTGGVAMLGFGLGGSLALWSAPRSESVKAVVAFYPLWDGPPPRWDGYAGKTAVIHCSEEGLTSGSPDLQVAQREIKQAGGECILYDYPATPRAFFNDDLPEVYDADAAASAWARTLDLFRTRLG